MAAAVGVVMPLADQVGSRGDGGGCQTASHKECDGIGDELHGGNVELELFPDLSSDVYANRGCIELELER